MEQTEDAVALHRAQGAIYQSIKIVGKAGMQSRIFNVDPTLSSELTIIQMEAPGIVHAVLIEAIDTFRRTATNYYSM